jgi:hypothetical protein
MRLWIFLQVKLKRAREIDGTGSGFGDGFA